MRLFTFQRAHNIDDAVKILGSENNGLYSNEWLLADVKTSEIAMIPTSPRRCGMIFRRM